MNKIFKYFLIGIGVGSIFFASCKADLITSVNRESINMGTTSTCLTGNQITGTFCTFITSSAAAVYFKTGDSCNDIPVPSNSNGTSMAQYQLFCFESGTNVKFKSNTTVNLYYYRFKDNIISSGQCTNNNCPTIDQNYCTENNLCPSCPSCPTCDDPYTSLECQTEYNLIPISSVTSAYCESNFNLIDPATCPINEGTGAINWSSLFINNTQYAGNDEIQILFPEYLAWNIVFNTGVTYVEVEGYNADTDYIEDVIAKEKLTPTADDFSFLIENLGAYIPILAVAGLLIRGARILKKVF